MTATVFIMASTSHGKDNAETNKTIPVIKEDIELLLRLRTEYIFFFCNFYW